MKARYSRNLGSLTPDDIASLRASRVCVVGCGGLGGYVIEELARLGVGEITAVDPDRFDPSNLNRQLYATEANLGSYKAVAARERVREINSEVSVIAVRKALGEDNAETLIKDNHLVIDALDSADSRRILSATCAKLGLTLVHGAISGWHAQISVLPPGSDAFDYIYPPDRDDSDNTPSTAFTPALCASIEVAEAVKVILNKGKTLAGRLLMVDLLNQEYNIVNL